MPARRTSIHGEWSSKLAFILAATGSAVGLGNIWRFPYVAGESGGGAFVLVYLACVLTIGLPVMIAEILIGRRGRQSPINTMRTLAVEEGHSPAWQHVGLLGMAAGFIILSFYSVIAGWTLAYMVRTAAGVLQGVTAEGARSIFADLVGDPEKLLAWHTIFMVMTIIVVSRGVQSGLEQATKFLMPALFVLLVAMVGYAMNTGQFQHALRYLFMPDFGKITTDVVLNAMGQAFFSLSLGMGAIMIYGSYLSHNASIVRTAVVIVSMDTLVALLAGLAIFPLVFQYQLEPTAGAGLIFQTLPIAFGQMPGGIWVGTAFFVLLLFAAWTSAISLLEPAVTWLVENHGMNRVKATAYTGIAAWGLGILSILSLNAWSDVKVFGKGFLDLFDYLSSNVMLPIGGFLICTFAAWLMSRESTRSELGLPDGFGYRLWRFLVQFVSPVAIVLVFLNKIGLFGGS
ncbi:MAG: sodium-dependent transporter [Gammaproteobacteria bacterium]|nr:MAG: sodium-dependent transporter [Gammaproteobacteria bacterium]